MFVWCCLSGFCVKLFSAMMQLRTWLTVFVLLSYVSCKKPVSKDLSREPLIPVPVELVATKSSFELTNKSDIYVSGKSSHLLQIGQYLADLLNPSTGFNMEVKVADKVPRSGNISLTLLEEKLGLGDEGYRLIVTSNGVKLEAEKPAGLFWGVQTIRQLLTSSLEASQKQEGPWLIASGTIKDYPKYGYRGAMLDVCRHFFPVKDVKRFIDLMVMYKMNILHLHLTDDQGWRIEIKSWPDLTLHGGKTEVGGGDGGFYTQDQYADIVKYAQERYVTIIPEIDMPGHTNAALASYPELNCDGKARELYTGIKVGFSSLCVNKEITYRFIDDVIREVAAMTPGDYIHIGGDESLTTKPEDYVKFINRVQGIVASYGKTVIGWDDISAAKLSTNTIVQFWQTNTSNVLAAVAQGARVIMSPASYIYLDMKYDSITPLGLNWAGYIEVDKAYSWVPDKIVEGVGSEDIMGVEAPLWTETIETIDDVEYMIIPRMVGCAELGWSFGAGIDWEDYKIRLGFQKSRFEIMNINYYPSPLVPWQDEVSTLIEE